MDGPAPLILTACFAPDDAAELQALRDRYFPPERNIVPAHLTMFHKLPGEKIATICRELHQQSGRLEPVEAEADGLRFLGHGVALNMSCEPLVRLRSALAASWSSDLTAQDRQTFRPHVTIQNKVSSEAARSLFEAMSAAWRTRTFVIEGVQLWQYEGGPWRRAAVARFGKS